MSSPQVTFLDAGKLRVAHCVLGSGAPVLMLHGWGANIGLMLPLAQRLEPLGYQIFIPDLPGFGQSPAPPEGWGVIDYTNFICCYMDALGLKRAHIFSHSFGGRISLILGAEQPQRVMKMALANCAGVPSAPSPAGQTRLKTYRLALNLLSSIGLNAQAERLRTWYGERYGSADYKAASGVMRETFVKVVNQDLLPYAARIAAPSLLLWGDKDEDTPLWKGQLLEKTIPDAGLVVFEGAGHYSYLERLDRTVRVVDHFYRHEA